MATPRRIEFPRLVPPPGPGGTVVLDLPLHFGPAPYHPTDDGKSLTRQTSRVVGPDNAQPEPPDDVA